MLPLKELAKFIIYRAPLMGRAMAPRYLPKVDPAQLCSMLDLIDATRETGAAVIEIGVAQGGTSTFLLEHLKCSDDQRPLLLFDTFSGFTPESIEFEVTQRGKMRADLQRFRYTDEATLSRNLRRAGYENFRTYVGDASEFDWSGIGPIGAVLLDIDLYLPTRKILSSIWPHMVDGGGIVVDDCLADTPDDGAMQAYAEFTRSHRIKPRMIGSKGGLLVKPGAPSIIPVA